LLHQDTDISQGSVTTHLRCGEIFSDSIITNFLLVLTVKKKENWSIFHEVIRRTKYANFWATLHDRTPYLPRHDNQFGWIQRPHFFCQWNPNSCFAASSACDFVMGFNRASF